MKKLEIKHVSLIQKNDSIDGISIEEKIRVALQSSLRSHRLEGMYIHTRRYMLRLMT